MDEMIDKPEFEFRAGYVAVMGRPNVGKSTLINTIMGQNIAAVSPKAQTTRQQQLGILTTDDFQIVFVDTPGLHNPRHKLGEYMNFEASEALTDADVVLVVIDINHPEPHPEDVLIINILEKISSPPPVILVMNKTDKLTPEEFVDRSDVYKSMYNFVKTIGVSATRNLKIDDLLTGIKEQLPESAPYFPEDQVTDLYEREIAADLVRAAALANLRDEVPHSVAIRIDEYKERNDHGAYIAATLFVEKDSQKGIVIGKDGKMLKRIGSDARRRIESMSGRKVFLRLRVKVRKNWRNDENALKRFGFRGR